MYNPTHYYVRVSRGETFIGRSLASQTRAILQGKNFRRCWMFQALWMGTLSCVSKRAAPGLETRAILNGPSHMGERFCSPSLESTRLMTRSPTSNVLERMLEQ